MEVAAAALGHDVDRAAGAAPVLGLVVRRQHLDLGDRVEAGREERPGVRSGVEVGDAVVGQVDGVVAPAVDADAAQVVPAGGFAVLRVDDAGQLPQHAHVVAALERDVLDLILRDRAGALAAERLDARRFGRHRDRLVQRADLERDRPERDALVGRQHDVALHVGLEPVQGDRDLVASGQQVGHREEAVRIRGHRPARLRAGVGHRDGRAGQHRLRRIDHRAAHLAGQALSVDAGRQAQHAGAERQQQPHRGRHHPLRTRDGHGSRRSRRVNGTCASPGAPWPRHTRAEKGARPTGGRAPNENSGRSLRRAAAAGTLFVPSGTGRG